MGKRIITLFVALVLMLSILSIVSSAAEVSIRTDLTKIEGLVYHWSGTWQHNGQDSTAGDPGSKCFDGNIDTKWGSADVSNGDQWVSVVFPFAVKISGFEVWQDNGPWTNITGFKAQIQNGSSVWQDVYTSPTYTSTWRYEEKRFESDFTATAFRIYIPATNAGGKSAVELTELVIYNINKFTVGKGSGNTGKSYKIETARAIDLSEAYALAQTSTANIPAYAIDGNANTKWASVGNAVPQWILVAFPNTVDVGGFKLVQDHAWTDVTGFIVEAYVAENWQTLYTHTGSAINDEIIVPLDTLWNIDAIRFTFTEVGQNATAGHGTTSIDFKEIVLYTADAVEPETNPQTGDAGYFIIFVLILAACLVKSRKFLVI